MNRNSQQFQTIHSEGGLLPADLLRRVVDPQGNLPGTKPEDYGLPPVERINEAITQSWNRMRRHWAEFRTAARNLPENEPGTGLTNDKWSVPLLRELGFGLLPTSVGPEVNGRTYAINRFFGAAAIHLVGCGVNLDRRAAGVRGAAATNPHGLVQEFLNRSPGHLWAIVSNGLRFRILRDNQALSRQSYLEFDLEAIFAGEVFSDFVLLWLMAHATRFAPQTDGRPETCWLEQWTKVANEEGTRALGDLRAGVEKALQILGEAFVSHPKNTALREALRGQQLSLSDFHGQLLRLVYRLIFLFVAEDRTLDGISLLHPRDDSDAGRLARERYATHYSTARLRDLAGKIKGSRHGDLWQQFNLLVGALSGDERFAAVRENLALPVLGSFLWSPDSTKAVNAASLNIGGSVELGNADFLEALRHLAYTRQGKVLRPVDYKNLGAEELGGVYETLLALTPQISGDGARFTFAEFAGNERKTSGSYYTPDSLVQCLLDSALDPVVEERLDWARELGTKERASRGREIFANRIGSDHTHQPPGASPRFLPRPQTEPDGQPLSKPDASAFRLIDQTTDASAFRLMDQTTDASAFRLMDQTTDAAREASSGPGQPSPTTGRGGVADDHFPHWFFEAQGEVGPDSLVPYSLLAEKALLSLKVCDPAVGSGHFLVGAAHRLARHLARVRANAQGESEPSPLLYQQALRDVIGRCLYGVDINPMSAELCRVGLWLEALEPGKPLSFLDHHIQVGNSLLGTTPALLAKGIPDEAFTPIEGDVKSRCTELKRENKRERQEYKSRQGYLFDPPFKLGNLAAEFARLDLTDDDTIDGIRTREQRYAELVRGTSYLYARQLYDLWCASFVWKKDDSDLGRLCPTERVFRSAESNPHSLNPAVRDEVKRLAQQYQFFHWHLAFPDVFPVEEVNGEERASERAESAPRSSPPHSLTPCPSGFDVVLGNPPWERIKLQEKEWFAERSPDIAAAPNAAARKRLIAALVQEQPELHAAFLADARKAEGESHLIRNSSRFPLCGRGDVNTYTIFAESMRDAIGPAGRVGVIVPSGIATDDTTKHFFRDLVDTASLVSLYDFENAKAIFPGVHRSYKFCLLTLGRAVEPTRFAFFLHAVSDLSDPERVFTLSAEDIALLNPNTRTCPIFRSRHDAELTKAIYRRVPVLIREADPATGAPEENPWGVKFSTMFHMSNDSHLFRTREQLEADGFVLEGNVFRKRGSSEVGSSEVGRMAKGESPTVEEFLPLYEAKLFHQFESRWASYDRLTSTELTESQRSDPTFSTLTRYWTNSTDSRKYGALNWHHRWLVAWRDICRVTDVRTVMAAVFAPGNCEGGCLAMIPNDNGATFATVVLSALNSFAFDFVARQKVGGTHLKFFTMNQLPVLDASNTNTSRKFAGASSLTNWLLAYVLELTYTAWDLEPFAKDCGYDGPPFRWDEERRFLLRAELDAAFFHLYLRADEQGDWVPARKADGCPCDEAPEDLARLKASFPTPRDAVSYIMDTFPIVRRKDEEKYNGDYRTKRVILEIYDAMQEAIRTGQPYQTRLAPPPGPPTEWEAASQLVAQSGGESGTESAPLRWLAPEWLPVASRPTNWPSHIHPPRDVRDETAPAAPAIIVPSEELDLDRLLAAFREVRSGMSADFVVADPETNRRLQEAARELGLRADPARLNQALLNARKAGKLKDDPSDRAYRLNRQYEPYVFASEWAVRHLQRQLLAELDRLPALDELLCNPEWAARFDEIVARIKPGFAPIDYRWAALSFRKRGRNKPDDAALDLPLDRQLTLGDWAKPLAPTGPGLYLICSDDRPTYVNWTSNLNDQIARHKEVAGDDLVPPWLIDGFGRASRIEYAEFLHRPPRQLQEMRIMQVAKLKPWLNLLDFGDAA